MGCSFSKAYDGLLFGVAVLYYGFLGWVEGLWYGVGKAGLVNGKEEWNILIWIFYMTQSTLVVSPG